MREASECLRAKGEVGNPAAIATVAQLDILFGSREGSGSILVRLDGTCARAHQGPRSEPAQRAKVGYRPCCARATHIAIPPRYTVGEFSKQKANGLQLLREHSPWAAGRLAACVYAKP